MFVTRIAIATTIVLMGLTGPSPVGAGHEDDAVLPRTAATLFPDGFVHDFGKVQRGTLVRFAFRFVNASDVPLRVLSLRTT
jgi:hypothetical protein